jgi:hypothetical protein
VHLFVNDALCFFNRFKAIVQYGKLPLPPSCLMGLQRERILYCIIVYISGSATCNEYDFCVAQPGSGRAAARRHAGFKRTKANAIAQVQAKLTAEVTRTEAAAARQVQDFIECCQREADSWQECQTDYDDAASNLTWVAG